MQDPVSFDTPLAALTLGQLIEALRAEQQLAVAGARGRNLLATNDRRADDKRARIAAAREALLASFRSREGAQALLSDLVSEHRGAYGKAAVIAAVHELRSEGALVLNPSGDYELPKPSASSQMAVTP